MARSNKFTFIAAEFYSDRDIKIDHSIVHTILKRKFRTLLAFLISNVVGNIFLSSSVSGNKPWDSLVSV